jgi:hypothetical protein
MILGYALKILMVVAFVAIVVMPIVVMRRLGRGGFGCCYFFGSSRLRGSSRLGSLAAAAAVKACNKQRYKC